MIDIHTHILPGLDDGPSSLAESIVMARAAAEDGITDLVATPHSSWGTGDAARVQGHVFKLQEALGAADIALRIAAGVEVWLTEETVDLFHAGRAFTINGGNYMLVEFPPYQVPPFAQSVFRRLRIEGVRLVLAHPERYPCLERNLEPLYEMVRDGVVMQITAGSLLGMYGEKTKEMAEIIIAHNLAHVIASDAHSANHRLPVLSGVVKLVANLVGSERAQAMVTTTPGRILAGEPVVLPEPLPFQADRHKLLPRSI